MSVVRSVVNAVVGWEETIAVCPDQADETMKRWRKEARCLGNILLLTSHLRKKPIPHLTPFTQVQWAREVSGPYLKVGLEKLVVLTYR